MLLKWLEQEIIKFTLQQILGCFLRGLCCDSLDNFFRLSKLVSFTLKRGFTMLIDMFHRLFGPFNVVLFNTIVFFLVMSHLKAVFLDPGAVPLPTTRLDFSDLHSSKREFEQDEWTVCTRCETFRPPRAHHCRICKRCIRRMDHHW